MDPSGVMAMYEALVALSRNDNAQEEALAALAVFLDRQAIQYMVIGGVMNAMWGNPQATVGVDVMVWVVTYPYQCRG